MRRKENIQNQGKLQFEFISNKNSQSNRELLLSNLFNDLFPNIKLKSATSVYLIISSLLFFIELIQTDIIMLWYSILKFYVFVAFCMMICARVERQFGAVNFGGILAYLFFVNYVCSLLYQDKICLSSPSSIFSIYTYSFLEQKTKNENNLQIFGSDSFRSLGNNNDHIDIWSSNQAIVRLSLDESAFSYPNYGYQSYGNREFRNYYNSDRPIESKSKKRKQLTSAIRKEDNQGPTDLTKIYKFIVFSFLVYANSQHSEWISYLFSVFLIISLNKIQGWWNIGIQNILLIGISLAGIVFLVKIFF